jgi:hypothetical protein
LSGRRSAESSYLDTWRPDLGPQIDVPKEKIIRAVQANVRQGNKQISLATGDMFIGGQVRTGMPFYFPNREALLDLFSEIVNTPGLEQHLLSQPRGGLRSWSRIDSRFRRLLS